MSAKRIVAILFMVSVLIGMFGCVAFGIFGAVAGEVMGASHSAANNGPRETITQALEPFEYVSTTGSIDVSWERADTPSVTLSGPGNLVKKVKVVQTGKAIAISVVSGYISFGPGVSAVIKGPQPLGFTLTGSGDLEARDMDGGKLSVVIMGSGNANLTGSVDEFDATVNGSGDIDAGDLSITSGKSSTSGSGNIELGRIQKLDVSISGSGDVRYRGKPELHQIVHGSGEVSQSGD